MSARILMSRRGAVSLLTDARFRLFQNAEMSLLTLALMVAISTSLGWQQVDPEICPKHQTQGKPPDPRESHPGHAEMVARGNQAMGFDQARASHHFILANDGGNIEIHVNERNDADTRRRIVTHLEQVQRDFKAGQFASPAAIHAVSEPPGTREMTKLRDHIDYRFESSRFGGRIIITARHADALTAVHAFLRYQITEHRTGDPLTVTAK